MNYNNKPKLIYSYEYDNDHSNVVFDENNNGYFFRWKWERSRCLSTSIETIDNFGNVSTIFEVSGCISRNTLVFINDSIVFGIKNIMYAYSDTGDKKWEIEFSGEIFSITSIRSAFLLVTKGEFLWISHEGQIIKSHQGNLPIFGRPIPTKNRVFCLHRNSVEMYDSVGNLLSEIIVGEIDSPIFAPPLNINNNVLHVFDKSNNEIVTIDENGDVVNKFDFSNNFEHFRIETFTFNSILNNQAMLIHGTMSGKTLYLIDTENHIVINSFKSNGNIEKLPVWNKDGWFFCSVWHSRNKTTLHIFDQDLNEVSEFKISGELFNIAFDNNDNLFLSVDDRRKGMTKIYKLNK